MATNGETPTSTPTKSKRFFNTLGRAGKRHSTPTPIRKVDSSIQLSDELKHSPQEAPPTEVWFDVPRNEKDETIKRLKEEIQILENKFKDEENCRKNAERLCEELTREQEALRLELKMAGEDHKAMESLYEAAKARLSLYEIPTTTTASNGDYTQMEHNNVLTTNGLNEVSLLQREEEREGEGGGDREVTGREGTERSNGFLNLQQVIVELENSLNKERLEKREYFDSLQCMHGKLQVKEDVIRKMEQSLSEREESYREMERLLQTKEDNYSKMSNLFQEKKESYDKMEKLLKEREDDHREREKLLGEKSESLKQKTIQYEQALQTVSRFENELLSVEAQLTKERQDKYELQKKIILSTNNNKQLKEQIESCQNRIETYLSQLQILEKENKDLSRSKGTLESSNEDFKQALQSLHNASVKLNVGKPSSINPKKYNYAPEMRDYLNWVSYGIVDKWQTFAYQLKLSEATVRTISSTYWNKPTECCREVFSEWKNKQTSPFTWCTLLTALLSPSVGRQFIASLVVAELDRIHYC